MGGLYRRYVMAKQAEAEAVETDIEAVEDSTDDEVTQPAKRGRKPKKPTTGTKPEEW